VVKFFTEPKLKKEICMKKSIFLMLFLVYLYGCAHSPYKVLPPIYEADYPIIIGVTDSEQQYNVDIDSFLVDIISSSNLVSGVLSEPFDKSIVDILLSVEDVSIKTEKKGFFPLRWVTKGSMCLVVSDTENKRVKDYSSESKREGSSWNPLCRNFETKLLIIDLITDILDDILSDFEDETINPTHRIVKENKSTTIDINVRYPTLTDFRRKRIDIITSLTGEIPPSDVDVRLDLIGRDVVIDKKLYYEHLRSINNKKVWTYKGMVESYLPPSITIEYEAKYSDTMGNNKIFSKGELKTISSSLYRFKQAEILMHGTIISTFGGFVIVMLLYSL
jgi:hypothetical protein